MKDVILVLLAIVAGVLGALRFRDGQRVPLRDADARAESEQDADHAKATAEHSETSKEIEDEKDRLSDLNGDSLAAEFDSAFSTVRDDTSRQPGGDG